MRDITSSSESSLPIRVDSFRHWLGQHFPRLFETALPAAPERANSQLAQFPGLEFRAREIAFDDRAEDNDAAIRASLIYFKHRWPGKSAILDGPEAFRLKAWKIAQEVAVPIKGMPHTGNALK